MHFSHPILRWSLSLRDNMIWKILGSIRFGFVGRRRNRSRAGRIDALDHFRFAKKHQNWGSPQPRHTKKATQMLGCTQDSCENSIVAEIDVPIGLASNFLTCFNASRTQKPIARWVSKCEHETASEEFLVGSLATPSVSKAGRRFGYSQIADAKVSNSFTSIFASFRKNSGR
jgi:hypothetical protein